MHDVWITAAGAVSALGAGMEAHLGAVRDSRTGLARHELFGGNAPDPCMCGLLPADVLEPNFDATAADRADRVLERVVAEALGNDTTLGAECDFVVGTTLGNIHGGSRYYRGLRRSEQPDVSLVHHFLPCAPAGAVCRSLGITGRRWTISSACGSGTAALGLAFNRIRHGLSTRIVAAGVDVLSPYVVAGFNSLRLVSPNECRPFDGDRDGLNPGEGGAAFVVESAESARTRGAAPLAVIEGFGEALDAYHHTRAHPEGAGLAAAIGKALDCAHAGVETVDHIHLHGTATPANDTSEYHGCRKVFGSRLASLPACSTKSMTGHTYGGAGALSAAFCQLSLMYGIVPATMFHHKRDPEFADLSVSPEPLTGLHIRRALSLTLGFGGEAFALLLGKGEAR